MKATVPDQALMSEAADVITELRAKVASLEKSLKETQEELERQQALDAIDEDYAREMAEQMTAELTEKIEFLEADRLRLANLIHPETGICTVYAGKCWECDAEMRRLDEQARKEIDEIVDLNNRLVQIEKARDALALQAEQLRYYRDQLEEKVERLESRERLRNEDVRALCDAVAQLMPTSRTLKPLVEKVRNGLQ